MAEAFSLQRTASRLAIVAEARRWAGTPYHHQQSVHAVGCDCLGLLRGVWRSLYGAEPERPPAYTRDWAECAGQETLLDACRRWLVEIPEADAASGDVVVWRMLPGARAKHCGILTADGCMIHARQGRGVIEEPVLDFCRTFRKARVAGAFAFPGA